MSLGLKTFPLEQRKSRDFCKYYNFLDHKTSEYVIFSDLVQKALKEGKLQFGKKPKASMQVDVDSLQTEDAYSTELFEILMIEDIEEFDMEVEKGEQIYTVVDAEM